MAVGAACQPSCDDRAVQARGLRTRRPGILALRSAALTLAGRDVDDRRGRVSNPPLRSKRSLERMQLLQPARELVALPAVGAVGDVFFRILDHARERRRIELV